MVSPCGSDEAAVALHLRLHQFGGAATVEAVVALVGEALQRVGEVGLHEQVALAQRRVVLEKHLARRRETTEVVLGLGKAAGEELVDDEALARQPDRRRNDVLEILAAVLLQRQQQARRRARHAGSRGADLRLVGVDAAVGFEVHVGVRCLRRLLAEVDRRRAAVGHADHEEAAAAEVAGLRVRHRQRERGRDRRVDGVAAVLQRLQAHRRRVRLLTDHHATRPAGNLVVGRCRDEDRARQPQHGKHAAEPGAHHCSLLPRPSPRRTPWPRR